MSASISNIQGQFNMQQFEAFQASHATAAQSTACLREVFRLFGEPHSLMDIGCGPGHLVKFAAQRGIVAVGVDAFCEPRNAEGWALLRHDLSKPWDFAHSAELVLCWEVAEHIPKGDDDTFLVTLVRATAKRLIFTAATPGQGGPGHVNEQPHAYWRRKLERRGLVYEPVSTETLRMAWKKVSAHCFWYPKNVMVFTRNV